MSYQKQNVEQEATEVQVNNHNKMQIEKYLHFF